MDYHNEDPFPARWGRWRREPMATGRGTEVLYIGVVGDDVARAYERHGRQPLQERGISISRRVYHHLDARKHAGGALSEADLLRLPELLAQPRKVLYDTQRGERRVRLGDLIYVFDGANGRMGKIVVRPNYRQRMRRDGRRETATTNAVRSAGYVSPTDLLDRRYLPADEG